MAIATQFGLYPSAGVAGLQTCVWLPGQPPIVLVESDLVIPDRLWEVRGSGLWIEHVCETPLVHWSYGLEAFALEIDDPKELLSRGHGIRVPLGWELEFEADLENEKPDTSLQPGDHSQGAYRQHGRVHGLLLTKSDSIEFSGVGTRSHRWGRDAFLSDQVPDDLSDRTEQAIALPGPGHNLWVDFSKDKIPTAIAVRRFAPL